MSSVEAEGAVGANIGHSGGCITILMESSQQEKIKQKDSLTIVLGPVNTSISKNVGTL